MDEMSDPVKQKCKAFPLPDKQTVIIASIYARIDGNIQMTYSAKFGTQWYLKNSVINGGQ